MSFDSEMNRLTREVNGRANRLGGDFVIKAGAVVALAGIGLYAAKKLTTPGPPGGACSDPASPCYQAISPYVQSYQQCANSYAYYQHQFDVHNATAGTGLNSDQMSTLGFYRNCMDQQAAKISAVSTQFQPVQGLQDLLVYVGEGVAIAAVVYAGLRAAPRIITTLRTPPSSGSAAAAKIAYSTVQDEAGAGLISGADAGVFTRDLSALTTDFQVGDAAMWESLAAQNIVDSITAQDVAAAVSGAMVEDMAEEAAILGRL